MQDGKCAEIVYVLHKLKIKRNECYLEARLQHAQMSRTRSLAKVIIINKRIHETFVSINKVLAK